MTGKIEQVEGITSVQRRRRWSADEKGGSRTGDLRAGHVGLAGARRHGIAPNQLYRWRRLYVAGALSAPSADIVRSKKTRPAPTRGKSRIGRGWGPKLRFPPAKSQRSGP
jgi:transposase-like protein